MTPILRGRSRNGLPWRTGYAMLVSLNLSRYFWTPAVDPLVSHLARRISSPLMGGTNGPAVDNTFNCAYRVTWARPGERSRS